MQRVKTCIIFGFVVILFIIIFTTSTINESKGILFNVNNVEEFTRHKRDVLKNVNNLLKPLLGEVKNLLLSNDEFLAYDDSGESDVTVLENDNIYVDEFTKTDSEVPNCIDANAIASVNQNESEFEDENLIENENENENKNENKNENGNATVDNWTDNNNFDAHFETGYGSTEDDGYTSNGSGSVTNEINGHNFNSELSVRDVEAAICNFVKAGNYGQKYVSYTEQLNRSKYWIENNAFLKKLCKSFVKYRKTEIDVRLSEFTKYVKDSTGECCKTCKKKSDSRLSRGITYINNPDEVSSNDHIITTPKNYITYNILIFPYPLVWNTYETNIAVDNIELYNTDINA